MEQLQDGQVPDVAEEAHIVKAGYVLFFWGSTFAHAAACGADCKRVAGWVCQEGKNDKLDNSGDDQLSWAE